MSVSRAWWGGAGLLHACVGFLETRCVPSALLQYKSKTLSPRWLEQFDLYMYDDQPNQLEITVTDHDVSGRDDFMGR